MKLLKSPYPLISLLMIAAILMLFLVACTDSPSGTSKDMNMSEDEHSSEEHAEGETERVPNDGAVVRIVSPADGTSLSASDLVIEIETKNFDLADEDKHWHVYVDGTSWGMIMGSDTSYALNGVEPGEHHISVYLSIGTHEELEEGSSIMVTVEE